MKRYPLLTFLVFYSVSIFSQDALEPQYIGWRGKNVELHAVSDKDKKQHCLFVVGEDSIKGFLLNNDGMITHTYATVRISSEKLLGGFIREGKVYFYCYNSQDEVMHRTVFDGDSDKDNVISFHMKKEKELDKLSCGDHFIYVTVGKKNSELIVYDFKDEIKYDTMRYHSDDDLWKKLTKGNLGFSRDIDAGAADQDGRWAVDAVQNANKIFLAGDSLFVLMNNDRGITNIIGLDLLNKKSRAWSVVQDDAVLPADDKPHAYSDNSFLLNGKLYYVQATFDSMFVQVNDLATGTLVKRFSTQRQEPINFKNTPIIQEGEAFYSKGEKELDKTKQLLRKMVNGRALIVASRNSRGQVVVTIGSYTTARGGGGYFMGGGGGAPPTFMGGGGATWTVSARFKMLLDGNSFEHIDGQIDADANERVDPFTGEKSATESIETIFMMGDGYIYAYYDKEAKMLRMSRL